LVPATELEPEHRYAVIAPAVAVAAAAADPSLQRPVEAGVAVAAAVVAQAGPASGLLGQVVVEGPEAPLDAEVAAPAVLPAVAPELVPQTQREPAGATPVGVAAAPCWQPAVPLAASLAPVRGRAGRCQ